MKIKGTIEQQKVIFEVEKVRHGNENQKVEKNGYWIKPLDRLPTTDSYLLAACNGPCHDDCVGRAYVSSNKANLRKV